jgi:hypothetical protein
MAGVNLWRRVSDVEARVRALEARLGEKPQYAKLSDNPPTVEHAFAINRIIELAKPLAKDALDSEDPYLREAAGETLSWLEAIGR